MWVIYVLIGLFTTTSGWTIEAEYSGFSNLVTSIPVGTPGRPLKLSLDFSQSSSFLYDGRTDCPAFVGDCFDPSLSESQAVWGDCDVREWESCQEVSDVFALESESHAFNFKLLRQSSGSSVAMREVAGMLSLNPEIVGCVEFTSNSLPGITISSDFDPTGVEFEDLGDDWTFASTFADTAVLVQFDPNVETMLLPLELETRMLSALEAQGVVISGSINSLPRTVGCDSSFSLVMGKVELTHRVLVDHECRLRYVLAVSDQIVIGRQLIESVGSVIVDNGRIGFVAKEPETNEWIESRPLIPIFSPDFVTSFHPGQALMEMEFAQRLGAKEGLFLWQSKGAKTFRMVNTEEGSEIVRKRTARGRWVLQDDSPYFSAGRLKLRFVSSEEGKVVIVRTNRHGIDVSLAP